MAWEQRGKNRYFYSVYREDGRVVKAYLGRDSAGKLAASALAESQIVRKTRLACSKRHANTLKRARSEQLRLFRECERRLEVALGIEGYHRVNHGPWRRRRAGPTWPRPLCSETPDAAQRLVRSDSPLVKAARDPWIELLVGDNPELATQLGRSADEVRDALAGDDYRSDVRLLAERAAVAWLSLEYAKFMASSSATKGSDHKASRRGAELRWLWAVRDVAIFQKLLPLITTLKIVAPEQPGKCSNDESATENLDRAVG